MRAHHLIWSVVAPSSKAALRHLTSTVASIRQNAQMTNDLVVLRGVIDRDRVDHPDLQPAEHFELFVNRQILKQYDPSDDEILGATPDGADDGGIDGFFTYVNDQLVDDAFDPSATKARNPRIDVYLVQTKLKDAFQETPLVMLAASARDLLDLSLELDQFDKQYNGAVLELARRCRMSITNLGPLFPQIAIHVRYVTTGSTSRVSQGIAGRARDVEKSLATLFPRAQVDCALIGASELLDMSRIEPSEPLELRLVETPIATGDNAYVALARLVDYGAFVRDELGELRRYLFESNVRDFMGQVEVNKEIGQTLTGLRGVDFWWLNNGITIIAAEGSMSGKKLTLRDVHIVNGLQTTRAIAAYIESADLDRLADEDRSVLVKIVITDDEEVRDRIIRATNFQTPVQPASFRAGLRLQRNIEDFFLDQGWYYDRRKNYYKNLGKPADRIVSITYLAQAVASIVLRQPDAARARPSSLVKDDRSYGAIFPEDAAPESFFYCARLMKLVDRVVGSTAGQTVEVRRKFRYHVAMTVVARTMPGPRRTPINLTKILSALPTEEDVRGAFAEVVERLEAFIGPSGLSVDAASKSRDFTRSILIEGGYEPPSQASRNASATEGSVPVDRSGESPSSSDVLPSGSSGGLRGRDLSIAMYPIARELDPAGSGLSAAEMLGALMDRGIAVGGAADRTVVHSAFKRHGDLFRLCGSGRYQAIVPEAGAEGLADLSLRLAAFALAREIDPSRSGVDVRDLVGGLQRSGQRVAGWSPELSVWRSLGGPSDVARFRQPSPGTFIWSEDREVAGAEFAPPRQDLSGASNDLGNHQLASLFDSRVLDLSPDHGRVLRRGSLVYLSSGVPFAEVVEGEGPPRLVALAPIRVAPHLRGTVVERIIIRGLRESGATAVTMETQRDAEAAAILAAASTAVDADQAVRMGHIRTAVEKARGSANSSLREPFEPGYGYGEWPSARAPDGGWHQFWSSFLETARDRLPMFAARHPTKGSSIATAGTTGAFQGLTIDEFGGLAYCFVSDRVWAQVPGARDRVTADRERIEARLGAPLVWYSDRDGTGWLNRCFLGWDAEAATSAHERLITGMLELMAALGPEVHKLPGVSRS